MPKQPTLIRTNGAANSTNRDQYVAEGFAAGEFVVYIGFGSDAGCQPQAPTFPGLTFTQRAAIVGFTGYGCVAIWTAPVPTGVSGTLRAWATWSGAGGSSFSWHLQVWKDVADYRDWWGNRGSGAPLQNVTQWENNSVFVYANLDWNVRDGAGRAFRIPAGAGFDNRHYSIDGQHTTYAGYYYNLGAPGAKTFGMTTPSTQKWTEVAIELKGVPNPQWYVWNGSTEQHLTLEGTYNGSTARPTSIEVAP